MSEYPGDSRPLYIHTRREQKAPSSYSKPPKFNAPAPRFPLKRVLGAIRSRASTCNPRFLDMGYGDSGKCGMSWSRHTQGCEREVQISSAGLNQEASSRVGKRMDMNSETASPQVKSGVPHSAQKLRVVSPPVLPYTMYVLGAPETSVAETATTMPDAKGAPLERWQSWQWQLSIAMGCSLHV